MGHHHYTIRCIDGVAPDFKDLPTEVLSRECIEAGEGLIHQQHFWLQRKCSCNSDTLLHSPREFLRICRLEALQAHILNILLGYLQLFLLWDSGAGEGEFDVAENSLPWDQCERLEYYTNLWAGGGDGLSVKENLA